MILSAAADSSPGGFFHAPGAPLHAGALFKISDDSGVDA